MEIESPLPACGLAPRFPLQVSAAIPACGLAFDKYTATGKGVNSGWHALSLRRAWGVAPRPSKTQGVPPRNSTHSLCGAILRVLTRKRVCAKPASGTPLHHIDDCEEPASDVTIVLG